jgi:hypothetical protein
MPHTGERALSWKGGIREKLEANDY